MIGGREGVQKFSYTIFFKRKKKNSSFSSGCFCSPSLKSYFSDLMYIVVFFLQGGWGQRGVGHMRVLDHFHLKDGQLIALKSHIHPVYVRFPYYPTLNL